MVLLWEVRRQSLGKNVEWWLFAFISSFSPFFLCLISMHVMSFVCTWLSDAVVVKTAHCLMVTFKSCETTFMRFHHLLHSVADNCRLGIIVINHTKSHCLIVLILFELLHYIFISHTWVHPQNMDIKWIIVPMGKYRQKEISVCSPCRDTSAHSSIQ